MVDQRASMLINDLSKVPNIVGGLGLAIAAAQKAFNLDYVESLERVVGLIQMLLAGKGADGKDLDTEQAQRLAEARPAIADMIKALAPSRYQYTETTLSVRLDLAQTKSVDVSAGLGVGYGGIAVNALVRAASRRTCSGAARGPASPTRRGGCGPETPGVSRRTRRCRARTSGRSGGTS